MNRTALISSLALGAAFAAPGVAAADSIVYLDGGNVWSASPDGTKTVQLTEGGGYDSPTQSDDGTIAARKGGSIEVMARDGRPIRSIQTTMQRSSNGGTFNNTPLHLSFSPDGTKIAYSYTGFHCPPASNCSRQESTFYTDANVTQATPVEAYGNQYGVTHPEWVSNGRTLVFGGAGSQVSYDDIGPGDDSDRPWMTPSTDMGDGEVSRDGKRLAALFSYGPDTIIAFFAVNGDVRTQSPPPEPDFACNTNEDEKLADPSWSPDGSGLAYQAKNGINVFRFTDFGPNRCAATDAAVLSPTGQFPDWGPADPPAARYVAQGGSGGNGGGGGGANGGGGGTNGGGGTVTPGGQPAIAFSAGKATRSALRKGLVVTVQAPAAGTVKASLSLKGKKVASGSAKAKGAGAVKVSLSKVGAKRAAKLKGKRLTLTVTAGGASTAKTLKIK